MSKNIENDLQNANGKKYDVIVVGGGAAGCAAALASARKGAKTLLVEKEGYLGGMLTGGMIGASGLYTVSPTSVHHYMKINEKLKTNPDGVQLIKGLPREIMRRLIQTGGGFSYGGEVGAYVTIDVNSLKRLLMKMIDEEGVDLLLYAYGVRPVTSSNMVKGIIINGKSGEESLRSHVVIDATGDGDIAAAAGAEYEYGRPSDGKAMNFTLMFSMANVDVERFVESQIDGLSTWPAMSKEDTIKNLKNGNHIWLFSSKGFLGNPDISDDIRQEVKGIEWSHKYLDGYIFACLPAIKGEIYLNVTQMFGKSGLSTWDLTDSVKMGYKQIELLEKIYKMEIPGFEKAYVSEIAPLMGVRESRRIIGDYVLTGEEILKCCRFDDAIAGTSHPLDARVDSDKKGPNEMMQPGTWADIPYRSILVKGFDNILTAGRCISVDHKALGSIRVSGTCMAIGEAAGIAAALASKERKSVRMIEGKRVREAVNWNADGLEDITGKINYKEIDDFGF